jgi:gamma-glutamyltranspeptidase/glutathione hydrolase
LYWLIQVTRINRVIFDITNDPLQTEFPSLPPWRQAFEPHLQVRVTKEHAQKVWEKMRTPGWVQTMGQKHQGWPAADGGHSDGVVAVDAQGNVAVLAHTIETFAWGTTGIFVGGISIPDTASRHQANLERYGPGGRMPNEITPLVVLRDGKPVLACTSIGEGLNEAALQWVHNVLEFGMDPKAAVETPPFYGPVYAKDANGNPQSYKQWIPQDGFSEELLQGVRERGQPLVLATEADHVGGGCIGITIDPESGERQGGTHPFGNGYALAE